MMRAAWSPIGAALLSLHECALLPGRKTPTSKPKKLISNYCSNISSARPIHHDSSVSVKISQAAPRNGSSYITDMPTLCQFLHLLPNLSTAFPAGILPPSLSLVPFLFGGVPCLILFYCFFFFIWVDRQLRWAFLFSLLDFPIYSLARLL